jgi:hypothetical protein
MLVTVVVKVTVVVEMPVDVTVSVNRRVVVIGPMRAEGWAMTTKPRAPAIEQWGGGTTWARHHLADACGRNHLGTGCARATTLGNPTCVLAR